MTATDIPTYVFLRRPKPALIGTFAFRSEADVYAAKHGGQVVTGDGEADSLAAVFGIGPVVSPDAQIISVRQATPVPPDAKQLRSDLRQALRQAGIRKIGWQWLSVDHRPAVWMTALGAFGAESPDGQARFFDHDLMAALRHAGLLTRKGREMACLRIATFRSQHKGRYGDGTEERPHEGQAVLWAIR